MFKFQLFHFIPLNFPRLVAKTASPGPEVSVPTLDSWDYRDFIWEIIKDPPGGEFVFPPSVCKRKIRETKNKRGGLSVCDCLGTFQGTLSGTIFKGLLQ